jgi:hypothetical protein
MIVVTQRVAVPEKALEHWASQYIAYRFRSKAAMWWPACGEDIDLDLLPARPGKAIQLEMKTTTPSGPYQDVKVDLGQLWEYHLRPLGEQPFYVFPRPDWEGSLAECSQRNRKVVTELGVARSGRGWWFADWLLVLTTAEICEVLASPLRNHGSSRRGQPARLVRFEPATNTAGWGANGLATPPTPLGWLPFWDRLLGCGAADWPQLIRVAADVIGDGRYIRHDQLAGLLQSTVPLATEDSGLVTFTPDGAGGYEIYSAAKTDTLADAYTEAEQGGPDDNRVAVFLDSAALG